MPVFDERLTLRILQGIFISLDVGFLFAFRFVELIVKWLFCSDSDLREIAFLKGGI